MSEFTSYAHGTPCWVDLGTTDTAAARDFYARLFGWDYQIGGPESGNYVQALLRGARVAGMFELMPEMTAQGVPPSWTTYLAVDDADAVAKRVADGGGTVLMGPMDVMSEGRLFVAQDPTGATFGGWQAGNHKGSGLANEHGSFTWNELLTRDPDRARAFYTEVFGYTAEDMQIGDGPPYTVFNVGGRGIAGMMQMPDEVPAQVPAHWMTYFAVDDADAAIEAARGAGGQVLNGPIEMPTVGRFAALQDPQGATFSVIRNAPPADQPG